MTSLLGACAMGDIGAHFPDTDERFRGADSIGLLKEAVRRMAKHGFVPYNCDITIAAQRPRLLPYIPLMRENLAQALGIPIDCVSVKATTTDNYAAWEAILTANPDIAAMIGTSRPFSARGMR